jgi:hypothetical protein
VNPADQIRRDFELGDNRVTIAGDVRVRLYFSQVRRALGALRGAVEGGTAITNAERQAVTHFAERLQQTYEILALRHFFSGTGPELRIDRTDSGLAHFSMLLELAADLQTKADRLAGLPPFEQLKRRMLDQIVDHGLHPRGLQEQMMLRLYLEALSEGKLFKAFVPGKLEKVGEGLASWFWSFATYDRALNRPFIYLIYFSYDDEEAPLEADSRAFAEIQAVAESSAAGRINLLAFSNRLDERVGALSPRIVKRLVLGPYWASPFTGADGELGELFESLEERLPFAMCWELETLISERETRVGAGWLSKGQLRQVFWIPKEIDLTARGVSQFERFVLLPHWLAQQVEAAGLLPDHNRIAILEEGVAS